HTLSGDVIEHSHDPSDGEVGAVALPDAVVHGRVGDLGGDRAGGSDPDRVEHGPQFTADRVELVRVDADSGGTHRLLFSLTAWRRVGVQHRRFCFSARRAWWVAISASSAVCAQRCSISTSRIMKSLASRAARASAESYCAQSGSVSPWVTSCPARLWNANALSTCCL